MTPVPAVFGEATRPCATCGKLVDPLRADRVAHIRDRFRYFCSASCRERYARDANATPLPLPGGRVPHIPIPRVPHTPVPAPRAADTPAPPARSAQPPATEAKNPANNEPETARAVAAVARTPSVEEELARLPKPRVTTASAAPIVASSAGGAGASGLLLLLAGLGGVLSTGLVLAGGSRTVLAARVVLAAVACAALVTERATSPRDPAELNAAIFSAAPVAAAGIAWGTLVIGDARAADAALLTSVIVCLAALSVALLRRARRPIDVARERLVAVMDVTTRRVVEDGTVEAPAQDLRPGEEILVEAGDVIPADATVTAGAGAVFPWLDAKAPQAVREGDTLLAGGRVAEGRLRAIVGWSGEDRAFLRLTNDPRRRADLLAPVARFGRLYADRGALLVTGLAALTAFAAGLDGVDILLVAVAVQAAAAHAVTAQVASLRVARTVLAALHRGIVFRTAEALDRAGRVTLGVFCARGTLLLGEPEVATLDAFNGHEPPDVLALVAGAESGEHHPVASAVTRTARSRGVRADAVRNPRVEPGLGVTAIASNGQPLAVGTRALLLHEHVSVGIAERRIQELESMGQNVLLVALAGRLVGLVGLQDGMRPGARAAVQHLLDAGLEPALLSGDARETCEALGRALAIDHLRPEVPPAERGDEIRRLVEGGATVAVIGQSPTDDAALGAADVAVALRSAGSTSADWGVQLATDDVRDAAFSLHAARDCLRRARVDLALTGLPALALAALAALGMLPPLWVPVLATAGTVLALSRGTTTA
jgi:cation transport ATPase